MDRDSRHFREWLERLHRMPYIPGPEPAPVVEQPTPTPRPKKKRWDPAKGPSPAQRERYYQKFYRRKVQEMMHQPRPGDKVLTPWGVGTIAEQSPFKEGLWITYESV